MEIRLTKLDRQVAAMQKLILTRVPCAKNCAFWLPSSVKLLKPWSASSARWNAAETAIRRADASSAPDPLVRLSRTLLECREEPTGASAAVRGDRPTVQTNLPERILGSGSKLLNVHG
jgi:hypothetical protein